MLVIRESGAKFTDMGMKYFQIIWLSIFVTLSAQAGTPAQAEAILQEHKTQMSVWETELAGAQSMEMMRQIVERKPDVQDYKSRMIKVVGAELKQPWALKYAGWLMANTSLGKKDVKFIMDYANKFHMDAVDLGYFCYNVAVSKQTVLAKKLFIEKAHQTIKDPKQKGVAAISLAIVLSEMGDSAVNNARRLSLVKQAIINSKDEKVGGTNVGEISMEMVHRLKNLSKGSPAPVISGTDSSGAPVNLAQYKGKVVMLVFWSSFDMPVEKTIELLALMRKIEKQYAGKNFALIGVNKDQLVNLRELEKESQTSSKNISDPQQLIFKQYRVGNPPHSYVIDQQGRIRFTGIIGSFATLTVDALLNPVKPQR
ncbi:MAG: TlpA disulfide reductase family protein [Rubritalea sp.]